MLDLETAARIATASDDPGCPLRLIVEEIARQEAAKAEGERKAERAWAMYRRSEAFFGPLRGIEGDPASPSRAHEPSPPVSALRVSPAIAKEK